MTALELSLVIGIGALALILIMVVAFLTKKNIVLTKGGVTISGGDDKKLSPHARCRHGKDIIFLLQEQQKILDEAFYLRHVGIIKDQMNYAEQKIDEAITILTKHYLVLLKEINGGNKTGISSSDQFRHYQQILKELKTETVQLTRHIMRENHFAEKTEDEFNIYEESRAKAIVNKGSDLINYFYYVKREGWPTREQIYDHNQKIIPQLLKIVKEVLREARKIAIEHNNRINGLHDAIDQRVKEMFG